MTDFSAPIIDIGANLTNRQFRRDLPQVLRRAGDAGLEAILLTGTSMASSRDAITLARRQQNATSVKLFSTVGVHPHDAKDFDEEHTLREMRELIAANPGIVCAVGECGLDFNRDFSPRDKQERVFRAQVELACELQLPLFLHERDAHDVFVRVLTPFLEVGRLPPVVVHCFTGSENEMRKYVSMGFYIGLTGYVCMDSRGFKLRTFAAQIPLDKLVIETDAPYMYPYGNNSRSRCEPKDLRAVIHTLASCYHRPLDEIATATTRNAKRLFALEKCEGHRAQHKTDEKSHVKNHPTATTATRKEEDKRQTTDTETVTNMEGIHILDGGQGEGGGQVIRIALGLATVLKKRVCIRSIRAKRKIPGLRNQHTRTVQLAQQLSQSHAEGVSIGSLEVVFDAQNAHLAGGDFNADSETGGSVSLMIQGSLPAMLLASRPTTLHLRGGTHVGFSPPVDFMQTPLKQLLSRLGIDGWKLDISKRGFFPGGRGEVTFTIPPLEKPLNCIDLSTFSNEIVKVTTTVTVYGERASDEVGQEFVGAMKRAFKKRLQTSTETQFEWNVAAELAASSSGRGHFRRHKQKSDSKDRVQVSILSVIETTSGGIISVDRTDKDTPEYAASKIVDVLVRHMENQVCVDEHLADNSIVYLALANGTSRLRVPCKAHRTSQHLETALEVAKELTGAAFEIEENEKNAVVTIHGVGFFTPR